jgi:hypothetical protein
MTSDSDTEDGALEAEIVDIQIHAPFWIILFVTASLM